ncbi:uncharacterized protein LOC119671756 [Teleopsis dalmanni]|uniref:uncharacterized protein LOC119671756 n=1 Tax=Teleopsis dalmanni TaxID=139649 RepID=UPI0018CD29ED|nr:uncharacterized protein LOC119671756 [Teleopsis dalmanni]
MLGAIVSFCKFLLKKHPMYLFLAIVLAVVAMWCYHDVTNTAPRTGSLSLLEYLDFLCLPFRRKRLKSAKNELKNIREKMEVIYDKFDQQQSVYQKGVRKRKRKQRGPKYHGRKVDPLHQFQFLDTAAKDIYEMSKKKKKDLKYRGRDDVKPSPQFQCFDANFIDVYETSKKKKESGLKYRGRRVDPLY